MFFAQKFFPDAQRKENLENGFTLIELLLYLSLSLVVFVVGGGILVSGLHAQSSTGAVTDAANTAQQIVRSVQAGVRNASAINVTADLSNGTQLLVARTIGADPNSTIASCQAWYYTPLNGGVIYSTKRTPAAAISLPAGGVDGVWSNLGTGISPSDPLTGKVFTAPNGGRVQLTFNVAAGAHPYVLVNTMTYTPQSVTVSSPCF